MKQISTLVLTLFLLVVLAACQKQKETTMADESSKNVIAKEEKPNFEIIDPWLRPGSARTNTAFFFKIVNNTDKNDTLIDASSDLARKVQVHETYKAENDMMGMRHVEFVPIPAGDTVDFKPRSLHVMVMGLYNDLMIGDSGKVTLTLKNAGDLFVTGVVRDMPKSMN